MSSTKFDPVTLVGTAFFNDINRLFVRPETTSSIWTPRVDLADQGDEFSVRVELPGVDPAAIDVIVENNMLIVSGNRSTNVAAEGMDGKYLRREILQGPFVRKIQLNDDVDKEAVKATSTNGILEITVPKQPAKLPRKVTVAVQR